MTTLAFRNLTLMQRFGAALALVLILLTLASGIGFAWFFHLAGRTGALPRHADGIAAFTGGAERVETALRLLNAGRADRLMLSGIGGGAELAELAHLAGVQPAPLSARVTLGRAATTTRGNALETAAWAQGNQIRSLIVVTAYYHMPRALTELERALPGVTLYPSPVAPAERRGRSGVPLRLMAEEYFKFVAATLGLSSLIAPREPAVSHGSHA